MEQAVVKGWSIVVSLICAVVFVSAFGDAGRMAGNLFILHYDNVDYHKKCKSEEDT